MSASNEWTDWHLTPRGWESGSEKVDVAGVTEKPRPDDAVLTVRWREYLSSIYSKMDRGHVELWRSDNAETIAKLIKEFGDPPHSL